MPVRREGLRLRVAPSPALMQPAQEEQVHVSRVLHKQRAHRHLPDAALCVAHQGTLPGLVPGHAGAKQQESTLSPLQACIVAPKQLKSCQMRPCALPTRALPRLCAMPRCFMYLIVSLASVRSICRERTDICQMRPCASPTSGPSQALCQATLVPPACAAWGGRGQSRRPRLSGATLNCTMCACACASCDYPRDSMYFVPWQIEGTGASSA